MTDTLTAYLTPCAPVPADTPEPETAQDLAEALCVLLPGFTWRPGTDDTRICAAGRCDFYAARVRTTDDGWHARLSITPGDQASVGHLRAETLPALAERIRARLQEITAISLQASRPANRISPARPLPADAADPGPAEFRRTVPHAS